MQKRKESIDNELIAKAAQGDSSAATQLVNKHKGALLSYISNIIPNTEDARDIMQESFHKCFKKLSTYNPEYAFSTWLFTIAQNTALDFIRKKRVTSCPINEDEESGAGPASAASPSPEDKMITSQEVEKLLNSIRQLPDIYRSVAEFRFIHDYPLEEIAKKNRIPLNTVKTRISRAKKLLNELWRN
jgi:RNA polymerase sigma-70 factor (ECF subfamily)